MNERHSSPPPSPPDRPGRRLYLLDTRHSVERHCLLEWLQASRVADSTNAPPDWVCLSLGGDERALDLEPLSTRLDDAEATTEVIPTRIAWRLPPLRSGRGLRLRDLMFGDPRLPGRLRAALILRRDRQRAQCVVGAPATIEQLRQRFVAQVRKASHGDRQAFAGFVARQAALTLDAAERGVQGSRYKVPRFVADSILAGHEFQPAIERIAAELGLPVSDLMKQSRACLAELVATPSALFLDLRAHLDRFIFTRGYDRELRCDRDELEQLRQWMRDHPTVLLFTHKSYVDASVPGLLLYENDLPMLHTFGGINLDIAGFGTLMRRSGGIFIRRAFHDDPVYKLVLRRYVAYLLEKRFPMSWALEGTRSRLGKLMPPRYGLLKYTLDAAHDAGIEDLHVVPFVTSFDEIRDVEEYAAEQTGRAKSPESFGWLLGYVFSRRRPMGRLRVDLGEPIVVNRAPEPGDRRALEKIALEAGLQANRVTPLTVTAVICLVVLGTAPRGVTAAELVKLVAVLADWARARGIRMTDELAAGDRTAIFAHVDRLADGGLLLRYDDGSMVVYAIEPSKHPIASYYRNTIVHHFLHKAFIELALSKVADEPDGEGGELFWAEVDRLRELLKFEFYYPPREQFRGEIVAELERTDPEWQERLRGGSRQVQRLARRMQPFIAHATLLPYVEAYSIVVEQLARLKPGERVDAQRCVARALKEGRQAYLLRRVSSEASIGRLLFENGLQLATHRGLADHGTTDTVAGRVALLTELRSLSRRMERMRLEALARAEEVMATEAGR